jgi:hypothetical protein
VKTASAKVGPGPNHFSDSSANVRVDSTGRLHLRTVKSPGHLLGAEVGDLSIQWRAWGDRQRLSFAVADGGPRAR